MARGGQGERRERKDYYEEESSVHRGRAKKMRTTRTTGREKWGEGLQGGERRLGTEREGRMMEYRWERMKRRRRRIGTNRRQGRTETQHGEEVEKKDDEKGKTKL